DDLEVAPRQQETTAHDVGPLIPDAGQARHLRNVLGQIRLDVRGHELPHLRVKPLEHVLKRDLIQLEGLLGQRAEAVPAAPVPMAKVFSEKYDGLLDLAGETPLELAAGPLSRVRDRDPFPLAGLVSRLDEKLVRPDFMLFVDRDAPTAEKLDSP